LQVNTLERDRMKVFIITQGSENGKKLQNGVCESIGGRH
jgi:hypothetical protein